MSRKAIILLSGGLDSATVLAMAIHQGYDLYPLHFRYGQKHSIESKCCAQLTQKYLSKQPMYVDLDCRVFGSSSLVNEEVSVPSYDLTIRQKDEIPSTYVPARNLLFLSYALAYGESINVNEFFIGATATDYSGYPDCRLEFFQQYQKLAKVATRMGVEGQDIVVHVPLQFMEKSDIIKKGIDLGVDYSMTHTCYSPSEEGVPCGQCDSCFYRSKGFERLGLKDPALLKRRQP